MSFSRSRQETVTSNLTENVQRNLNVQDSEDAVTVAETGGDVTIIQTDQNAFDRATELAQRSLDVGESIARDSQSLSLQVARMTSESALMTNELVAQSARESLGATVGLARESLYSTEEIAGRAIESAESGRSQIASVASGALDKSLDFVRGLQTKFQDTIAGTVDALQRIGVEQNKSTDQRLAESTTTTTKYLIVGLIALGAVVTIALVQRSR